MRGKLCVAAMSNPIDPEFRPLKDHERELIEKLLGPAFVGRDELRLQLNSTTARQVMNDGTLFLQCDPGSPALGKNRLVMEATWTDADGGSGCVMLHVKDGYMSMLEILKYGPSEIIQPPAAHTIVLL
jgi:hypothetical protein